MEDKIPDLTAPEYSRFTEEQKQQIRELYSYRPLRVDVEALKKSLEAERRNTPPGFELPRYNPDGTRRQVRGWYPLIIKKHP